MIVLIVTLYDEESKASVDDRAASTLDSALGHRGTELFLTRGVLAGLIAPTLS